MSLRRSVEPKAEPISADEAKLFLREDDSGQDLIISSLIKSAREYVEGQSGWCPVLTTYELRLDSFPDEFRLPRPPLRAVVSLKYQDASDVQQTLTENTDYTVDLYGAPPRVVPAYGKTWPSIYGDINDVILTYRAGWLVPYTVDTNTDVITAVGHPFGTGDPVLVSVSGGATAAVPTGLALSTVYYVRDVSGDTLKLAASAGGAAIDITAAGTGTQFLGVLPAHLKSAMLLLVAHLYEHREAATEVTLSSLPVGLRSLIWHDRVFPMSVTT